jgi:GDP-D-mannose dehydratase
MNALRDWGHAKDYVRMQWMMLLQEEPKDFVIATLLGDPSKAKADLGWVPEITLDEMDEEMVAHDLDLARRHAFLKANGHRVEVSKES